MSVRQNTIKRYYQVTPLFSNGNFFEHPLKQQGGQQVKYKNHVAMSLKSFRQTKNGQQRKWCHGFWDLNKLGNFVDMAAANK